MNYAIIGVGGIGILHAIAVTRTGNMVTAIIDRNEVILKKTQKRWRNEWLGFVDEVTPNPDCQYCQSIDQLTADVDKYILAVPPEQNKPYLEILSPKPILVEKPISLNVTHDDHDNVEVSTEWRFSKNIPKKILSMEMSFLKTTSTKWGYTLPAKFDFIPHFASIIDNVGIDVREIYLKRQAPDFFEGLINGNIVIKGDRKGNGFKINGNTIYWEFDLLDRQIKKGGMRWETMKKINNLICQS